MLQNCIKSCVLSDTFVEKTIHGIPKPDVGEPRNFLCFVVLLCLEIFNICDYHLILIIRTKYLNLSYNTKRIKIMNYQIDSLKFKDWPQIRSIYMESISTGFSTFDVKSPSWKEWDTKRLSSCGFVARKGKTVYGWATLTPSSST